MNTSSTPAMRPVILKADEGQTLTAFGDTVIAKLTTADTKGAFSLGLLTTPSQGGPPLHRHTREDELFLVVAGCFRFVCDGATHDVGPGGAVFLPRQTVHTFMVTSPEPGQAWVLLLPGEFEKFFGRCASEFRPGVPPDLALITKIGQEFGIEFLGPPLAATAQD